MGFSVWGPQDTRFRAQALLILLHLEKTVHVSHHCVHGRLTDVGADSASFHADYGLDYLHWPSQAQRDERDEPFGTFQRVNGSSNLLFSFPLQRWDAADKTPCVACRGWDDQRPGIGGRSRLGKHLRPSHALRGQHPGHARHLDLFCQTQVQTQVPAKDAKEGNCWKRKDQVELDLN